VGEYSDYHIVGIFDDIEKANEAKHRFDKIIGQRPRIETYNLNQIAITNHIYVKMDIKGNILECADYTVEGFNEFIDAYFVYDDSLKDHILVVSGTYISKDKLIKTAQDIRTLAINEDIWGDTYLLRELLGIYEGE